jgi:hypothetical protein
VANAVEFGGDGAVANAVEFGGDGAVANAVRDPRQLA